MTKAKWGVDRPKNQAEAHRKAVERTIVTQAVMEPMEIENETPEMVDSEADHLEDKLK